MPQEPIRVGIVGCGNAARTIHAPLLRKHAQLYQLHACTDIVTDLAERFAAEHGPRFVPKLDDLLDDASVELVVVTTRPPSTHHDVAVAALARGKHVVVEKPMADDAEQCNRMIEAAQQGGRILTVHQNRRWDVDFLNAFDALRLGKVGAPRLVRNEFNAGYRGSCYDWGIHIVDQTMCLSMDRRFIEITATMARPNLSAPLAGEGFFSARLLTEDGVAHDMSMLPAVDGNAFRPGTTVPRFVLVGTEGIMIQQWCQRPEDAFGSSIRHQRAESDQEPFGDPPSVTAALSIPDFYERLHGALRAGGPAPVCPRSARRSVTAWELVCKAASAGRTLSIEL
jgi:scyllo-inositol 2-dehydrogenase (NADP+)